MNKNINVLRSQTRLSGTATNGSFDVVFDGVSYDLKLTPITLNAITLNFPENSTLPQLDDAPYKMFAIPYCKQDAPYLFSLDGSLYYNCDKDVMMAWAMSIAKELGGGGQSSSIYDLQLLPYCPLSNWRGKLSSPGIWSMDKKINDLCSRL